MVSARRASTTHPVAAVLPVIDACGVVVPRPTAFRAVAGAVARSGDTAYTTGYIFPLAFASARAGAVDGAPIPIVPAFSLGGRSGKERRQYCKQRWQRARKLHKNSLLQEC